MCNNTTTFQPYNLSTNLILRQDDLSEHGIPERRSITHGSEAQGKKKMPLYAHKLVLQKYSNYFERANRKKSGRPKVRKIN